MFFNFKNEQQYAKHISNKIQIDDSNYSTDSNPSLIMARKLIEVSTKLYEIKYPELAFNNLVTVTSSGKGLESVGYDMINFSGTADFVSNGADDLPRSDAEGKQYLFPVRTFGASYGYTLQELWSLSRAGSSLDLIKAKSVRRSMEQLKDKVFFFGDKLRELNGLLSDAYLPLYNQYVLPADGTGASTKLKDKTPDKVIRDLCAVINQVSNNTLETFQANVLVIDNENYTDIESRVAFPDGNSALTIKDHVEKIKRVTIVSALKFFEVDSLGGDSVMMAMNNSDEVLSFEIPLPFEQLPLYQESALRFIVPCLGQISSLQVRYPKAISYARGV
jgi:hypothetical protein